MLMRDVNIRNKDFISLLDRLSASVNNLWDNHYDLLQEIKEYHLEHCDPEYHRKKLLAGGITDQDPYDQAPHWDILPFDWREQGNLYDPCGEEYLSYMKVLWAEKGHADKSTCGFPNKEPFAPRNAMLKMPHIWQHPAIVEMNEVSHEISYNYLGGFSIALTAFYLPGGFIPWHHNANAPGYNLLLHYSQTGEGWFYTEHDGKIVEYKDKPREWIARAGVFKQGVPFTENRRSETYEMAKDVNDLSWHAAKTECNRFTLSTIINNRDMWENLIAEIEEE